MEVRAGSVADHDAAVAVWRAASVAFLGAASAGPRQEARARAHLDAAATFLLVAEEEGVILGMGVATQARDDGGAGSPVTGLCHVAMVYVDPDRWGEGIGQRLVDAVLAAASTRGYTAAQLWTPARNDHAQRLYEGKGFRRSGREQVVDGTALVHYDRAL